uniref:Arf-GAP domain-containing protein n=1 Tax=Attheya septentrionalis TaxID=420275 RepID=A0A7S2UF59_9STRA|mmetsp:Transcript_20014/g.36352  ORF Transcript_20014/g.36352 Transcript_20014/m.36352 type:complete len:443 (+) Transcript_20014:909-2237(+)
MQNDRSLGVHITFVRSIAMDSWTPQQMELMKAGGNANCAAYLSSNGVAKNVPIKAKYESDVAQLYKEILKARVEGRPEPTELVKKAPRSNNSYNNNSSSHNSSMHSQSNQNNNNNSMHSANNNKGGSNDASGMERLTGESEQAYVARQTRLREEAKARMAAKFGNSGGGMMGGMGGASSAGRMGGVGSDSSYNPATGGFGGGGGGLDVDSLVSGFGSALSTFGSITKSATRNVSSALQDTSSTGGGSLWSSISSGVQQVASSIAQPDDDNESLWDLQRKLQADRASLGGGGASKYGGFGSDDVNQRNGSTSTSTTMNETNTNANNNNASSSATMSMGGGDPNGIERLMGESDSQYMARQTRIRDEAKARMAAKFGGSGLGGVGAPSSSSSRGASSMSNHSSAPSSGNSSNGSMPQASYTRAKPTVAKMKVDSPADFFSSFGA